jgi:stage V sporulation protein R
MNNAPLVRSGQEWSFDLIEEVFSHIERVAVDEFKLDCYPNQLEIISSEQMLDAYASDGLPIYYPHWSFGEQFIKQLEMYKRGYMGLAYEIVINSNPCISYLMEENTMLMQTLVIAHAAFGHNHFFKNNYLFKQWTDAEAIIDYLVFAKRYIRECEEKYGADEVEAVLDAAHALQQHGVDKYKRPPHLSVAEEKKLQEERDAFIQSQLNDIWRTIPKRTQDTTPEEMEERFPSEPQENVLYFIEKHAPRMEGWKREIIRIVRKISQYFYPQMQTKVMNEGCLVEGSLIDTPNGFIRIEDIVNNRYTGTVIADEKYSTRPVSNWYKHENKNRVKIITHHGYTIHGGEDHKILIGGVWTKLKDLKIGDTLPIIRGNTTAWPSKYQHIVPVQVRSRQTIASICNEVGINYYQYRSWKRGEHGDRTADINTKCQLIDVTWNNIKHLPSEAVAHSNRKKITFPTVLDETFAYWLGLLVGDGNVYSNKYKKVNFTNQDVELLDFFKTFAEDAFGVETYKRKDRNHFNVGFYSSTVVDNLLELGVCSGRAAHKKRIPELLLQSPVSVVAAFIRGHADTDGCATNDGSIVLISKSYELISVEQQLLLKMGIVSRVTKQQDGCYRLYLGKRDARMFADIVGFGLSRKQEKLAEMSKENHWSLPQPDTTSITEITYDVGTTYDFTVDDTHQYKHSCVMNHNCATYFHYKIIHALHEQGILDEGAMLEFYHSHTGVVMQPDYDDRRYSGINPYALGFAMFQDIERIATTPTEEDREWFKGQSWVGSGDYLSAIHDAITNYKDESFIQQFLSPKVIRDLRLFAICDDERDPKIEISAIHNHRGYKAVRSALSQQYNVGYRIPDIQVKHVDRWGDRTLYLTHNIVNGVSLDPELAMETLEHLTYLWGYPVQLTSQDLSTESGPADVFKVDEEDSLIDVFMDSL